MKKDFNLPFLYNRLLLIYNQVLQKENFYLERKSTQGKSTVYLMLKNVIRSLSLLCVGIKTGACLEESCGFEFTNELVLSRHHRGPDSKRELILQTARVISQGQAILY